jgi:hypothetical protein
MYTKKRGACQVTTSTVAPMSLSLPILILFAVSVFPTATLAQDEGPAQIDGAQTSKVAITGAIIGGP